MQYMYNTSCIDANPVELPVASCKCGWEVPHIPYFRQPVI